MIVQSSASMAAYRWQGSQGAEGHEINVASARRQLEQERLGTTELCQSGSVPSPAAQQELCGFFLIIFLVSPSFPFSFELSSSRQITKLLSQLGQIAGFSESYGQLTPTLFPNSTAPQEDNKI